MTFAVAAMTTTRRALLQRVQKSGTPLTLAQLNAVLEQIQQALVVPGDAVVLRHFGRFEVRVRQERRYRNPVTGVYTHHLPVSFVHFKGTKSAKGR